MIDLLPVIVLCRVMGQVEEAAKGRNLTVRFLPTFANKSFVEHLPFEFLLPLMCHINTFS